VKPHAFFMSAGNMALKSSPQTIASSADLTTQYGLHAGTFLTDHTTMVQRESNSACVPRGECRHVNYEFKQRESKRLGYVLGYASLDRKPSAIGTNLISRLLSTYLSILTITGYIDLLGLTSAEPRHLLSLEPSKKRVPVHTDEI
jgi:hypothetical protein